MYLDVTSDELRK